MLSQFGSLKLEHVFDCLFNVEASESSHSVGAALRVDVESVFTALTFAALVVSRSNLVETSRALLAHLVEGGVPKANGRLASLEAGLVDQGHDAGHKRRRRAGSGAGADLAIVNDENASTKGSDIGVKAVGRILQEM